MPHSPNSADFNQSTVPTVVPVPAVNARQLVVGISSNGVHHGTIRIDENKIVIGSADDCTICLRSTRVQPRECVITRGTDRVFIRSLHNETTLNGEKFTEQWLSNGDRISCGPVDVHLIDLGMTSAGELTPVESKSREETTMSSVTQGTTGAPASDQADPNSRLRELKSRTVELRARLESQRQQLLNGDASAETDLAASLAELQSTREEIDTLLNQTMPQQAADKPADTPAETTTTTQAAGGQDVPLSDHVEQTAEPVEETSVAVEPETLSVDPASQTDEVSGVADMSDVFNMLAEEPVFAEDYDDNENPGGKEPAAEAQVTEEQEAVEQVAETELPATQPEPQPETSNDTDLVVDDIADATQDVQNLVETQFVNEEPAAVMPAESNVSDNTDQEAFDITEEPAHDAEMDVEWDEAALSPQEDVSTQEEVSSQKSDETAEQNELADVELASLNTWFHQDSETTAEDLDQPAAPENTATEIEAGLEAEAEMTDESVSQQPVSMQPVSMQPESSLPELPQNVLDLIRSHQPPQDDQTEEIAIEETVNEDSSGQDVPQPPNEPAIKEPTTTTANDVLSSLRAGIGSFFNSPEPESAQEECTSESAEEGPAEDADFDLTGDVPNSLPTDSNDEGENKMTNATVDSEPSATIKELPAVEANDDHDSTDKPASYEEIKKAMFAEQDGEAAVELPGDSNAQVDEAQADEAQVDEAQVDEAQVDEAVTDEADTSEAVAEKSNEENVEENVEESIEAYMERLLKRSGTKVAQPANAEPDSAPPATPQPEPETPVSEQAKPQELLAKTFSREVEEHKRETGPVEISAQSLPELETNYLDEMRQMSRDSARSAIEASHRRATSTQATVELVLAVCCLLVGMIQTVLAESFTAMSFLVAIPCYLGSMYLFYRYFAWQRSCKAIGRSVQTQTATASEETIEPAAADLSTAELPTTELPTTEVNE